MRRFTQRTRRRRAGLLGALGAFLVLAIVVGIAVYSPLLALRTVEVEGADRVSPDSIQAALADQVGTPSRSSTSAAWATSCAPSRSSAATARRAGRPPPS
ncbi:hypothetical protein [Clavibacter tessellarius]|uniref:hypothetical protein n=1 Tax=Clavibacter tessellarius TaxID=31965 RepID=UPI0039BFEA7E